MITVRLPEEHVERLDKLVAEGSYRTRAAAVTDAIERLIEEAERERIDRAIVEGYTRMPPTLEEDEWAEWSTIESIREEPW